MRFLLLKDLIHPLKNLPSRFRGPHPTFEPLLFNFNMGEPEPPKFLLLQPDHRHRPAGIHHALVAAPERSYRSIFWQVQSMLLPILKYLYKLKMAAQAAMMLFDPIRSGFKNEINY
eukprot:SAG22_NODE_14999_length_359_cov_4.953846_1_plen_115_part_10